MKVKVLILGLLVLLAFGCGKDDDEVVAVPTCKTTQYVNNGNIYELVYDGQDRLVQVNTRYFMNPQMQPYIAISYNAAGRISEVKSFKGDGVSVAATEVFDYNANGLLNKITLTYAGQSPYTRKTFEYNAAGQLVKESDHNLTEVFLYTTFTYLPGNKVKEERYCSPGNGTNSYSLCTVMEWTFGTVKNPMSGFGYINESLSFTALRSAFLPESYKVARAITNGVPSGEDVTVLNYTFNPEGYPLTQTSVTSGKESGAAAYSYNCQ